MRALIQCGEGQTCRNGKCDGNDGCGPGQARCNGTCTNLANDNRHCGACSVVVCVHGRGELTAVRGRQELPRRRVLVIPVLVMRQVKLEEGGRSTPAKGRWTVDAPKEFLMNPVLFCLGSVVSMVTLKCGSAEIQPLLGIRSAFQCRVLSLHILHSLR